MMLLSVLVIVTYLPKNPRFRYEFEKGKTWNNKDLLSPFSFPVLKSSEQLEKDKAAVLENILPVYRFHPEVGEAQLLAYTNEFDVKWKAYGLLEREKDHYRNKSVMLLKHIYQKGLIELSQKLKKNEFEGEFSVLQGNLLNTSNLSQVYTYASALRHILDELNTENPLAVKLIKNLSESHLKTNLIFDEQKTTLIEQEALKNVSQTRGMVQKGEIIVAKGTVVDQATYQKLLSFKKTYDAQAKNISSDNYVFIGQVMLVGFIISLLIVFLFLFRKDIYADNRQLSLLLLVITSMLLVLTWAIQYQINSIYLIPFCIVPIIIRILFDSRLALNLHLLVILIAGFFVPNSFEFVFYQTTAGMVAIYSIKNLVRREQLLVSAFFILSAYFVCFIGIALIREGSLNNLEIERFLPFVFSVLLSLLAYPLIYAFEKMFGITSDVALIELTNTNSKLLRELAFKAPGTFQHSLQVANLAEAAIFKLGGNALLVRAGALYHDIGKMENAQYFIENQTGQSPHDKLPYDQSAQIIIRHVYKGIEMARKHQLPESIIDFIRTHHGNTRVDYFYQSFLKNSPEKFIDENIFKYPGPIPFSKETGVLMLADSVEAASRSLKNPDAKGINDLVERIIDYKLEQKQLDNCDLTLKDLETIKLIFKTMLMSIYHVRVDYAQTM